MTTAPATTQLKRKSIGACHKIEQPIHTHRPLGHVRVGLLPHLGLLLPPLLHVVLVLLPQPLLELLLLLVAAEVQLLLARLRCQGLLVGQDVL